MKAHPGDRICLAPITTDAPLRDGEVLETRGPDGSEPFLIRWSDGHIGLLYPGPGSVLRIGPARPAAHATPTAHHEAAAASAAAPAATADSGRRVRDWQVRISIFESDNASDAHVVLLSDSPTHLTASGHSERGSAKYAVPEIGDELAVARALRRLADRLLDATEEDIEALTGEHHVTLRPR